MARLAGAGVSRLGDALRVFLAAAATVILVKTLFSNTDHAIASSASDGGWPVHDIAMSDSPDLGLPARRRKLIRA